MGLFSKIITALRGGAREVGESIVDANGIRIFEQEVRDAEASLQKAKKDLTEVMTKEIQEQRKVEKLKAEIERHEGYAAQALEKGDETLALEVAEKIGELTEEMEFHAQSLEGFRKHAQRLKAMIKKTSKSLAGMKRQLTMVKTTDNVQKATKAITDNYASSGSKLLTAKESLDRIQKRQQDTDDRLIAGEQLRDEENGASLDAKLKAAGIGGDESSKAEDILARIRAKKQG